MLFPSRAIVLLVEEVRSRGAISCRSGSIVGVKMSGMLGRGEELVLEGIVQCKRMCVGGEWDWVLSFLVLIWFRVVIPLAGV
jgi:hypothetical protein